MIPVDDLHEGRVVSDRFRLLRVLGRGGMGSVWVARHLSLHIDVAIKFIDGALADRDDLRSRFAQEARTAARIQSPHVVNILDYGFDGDRPFIAMELLQGESLGARLTREGQLALDEVAKIIAQAAKGLSRAHALGIVHRDLKPDNLLLCRDDDGALHVKILDFGIARDDGPFGTPSHRTGTGQILGTPAYMSPEQALARSQIDFHSDLYSLAVVAYHCIVGRLPFDTESVGSLIVSLTTSEPPPPSSLVTGLPGGIDSWFRCAFQKEPTARFASAKEMADTFALACRESPGAYDATVLAKPGTAPAAPRNSSPERTRLMTGIVAPGLPSPSLQSSRPPRHAAVPDTFVGQYASQAGAPPSVVARGPSSVVLLLAGLVVTVALVGAGIYATRWHVGARGGGATAAGIGPAEGASVLPPPPVVASAAQAPSVASATASATPAPSVSAAPLAPSASPPPARLPRRPPPIPAPLPTPTPRASAAPTAKPSSAPTNDYGL